MASGLTRSVRHKRAAAVIETGCRFDSHSSKLNFSLFPLVTRHSAALSSAAVEYAMLLEAGKKWGREA